MSNNLHATIETSIADIEERAWNACANPPGTPYNPFLSYPFLNALEESGCVTAETGWLPQHIVLRRGGEGRDAETNQVLGAMPLYLKSHSQGEYVFDHGWADAFERAGGRYYPKLISAVPFTPVTGRRLLVGTTAHPETLESARGMLLSAAIQLTQKHDVSSFHAIFVTETEWELAGSLGLLQRTDQQFHWKNDGYTTFDDFLAALTSRKRKDCRKERRQAVEAGIEIEWITGADVTEDHWDAFYRFYVDTGIRKWGTPYLNRIFFSLLGERMADDVLLVLCRRAGEYIAGALNLIGGDTLYGRYWGCTEHHPSLHFEVCYYQAIDFAIERGLAHVEAGAQGEHKLARGYVPTTTYSVHHLPDPSFRRAVASYLNDERDYIARSCEVLSEHVPFRKREP